MSRTRTAEKDANLTMCLTALESGDYTQGEGHLKKDGRFCCLGVFTDQYHIATGNGEWRHDDDESTMANAEVDVFTWTAEDGLFNKEAAFLPAPVMTWLGFDTIDPKLPFKQHRRYEDEEVGKATTYNDGGYSFAEIAQAFRDEYLS